MKTAEDQTLDEALATLVESVMATVNTVGWRQSSTKAATAKIDSS